MNTPHALGILGVHGKFNEPQFEKIKAARDKLYLKHHPDKGGQIEQFHIIHKAFKYLEPRLHQFHKKNPVSKKFIPSYQSNYKKLSHTNHQKIKVNRPIYKTPEQKNFYSKKYSPRYHQLKNHLARLRRRGQKNYQIY